MSPKASVLSYEALRDAYNVLRVGGLSLDERLDHYREHLRQRAVKAETIENRVARIRPFLEETLGGATPTQVVRPATERYAVRSSTGQVGGIIADGLNSGDAVLVAVDAAGGATELDVLARDAIDGDMKEDEG